MSASGQTAPPGGPMVNGIVVLTCGGDPPSPGHPFSRGRRGISRPGNDLPAHHTDTTDRKPARAARASWDTRGYGSPPEAAMPGEKSSPKQEPSSRLITVA